MKLKEFGRRAGGGASLDPPMQFTHHTKRLGILVENNLNSYKLDLTMYFIYLIFFHLAWFKFLKFWAQCDFEPIR